jgi:hypothetical protein
MTHPHEIYRNSRPRKGDPISYKGKPAGHVTSVEGNLCWCSYAGGESLPFIWCFHDGVNALHDWPTKVDKEAFCPGPRT